MSFLNYKYKHFGIGS